jgi:hypothetical protein
MKAAQAITQFEDSKESMEKQIIKEVCTAETSKLNYDMSTAPIGQFCFLLGRGGVIVRAQASKDPFWIAWAPLPKRDKAEEKRRGIKL